VEAERIVYLPTCASLDTTMTALKHALAERDALRKLGPVMEQYKRVGNTVEVRLSVSDKIRGREANFVVTDEMI
jgi:hypothetical protein